MASPNPSSRSQDYSIALGLLAAGVALAIPGVGAAGVAIAFSVGSTVGSLLGVEDTESSQEGPRRTEFKLTVSKYGQPIPRGYGAIRIGGNVIWASAVSEEVESRTTCIKSEGIFGTSLGESEQCQTLITYAYRQSWFIALCEGPIADVTRVWADGELVFDLSGEGAAIVETQTSAGATTARPVIRVIRGTWDQPVDSHMQRAQHADRSERAREIPAYRGIAGLVFINADLERFGYRIPTVTAEVLFDSSPPVRALALLNVYGTNVRHYGDNVLVGPSDAPSRVMMFPEYLAGSEYVQGILVFDATTGEKLSARVADYNSLVRAGGVAYPLAFGNDGRYYTYEDPPGRANADRDDSLFGNDRRPVRSQFARIACRDALTGALLWYQRTDIGGDNASPTIDARHMDTARTLAVVTDSGHYALVVADVAMNYATRGFELTNREAYEQELRDNTREPDEGLINVSLHIELSPEFVLPRTIPAITKGYGIAVSEATRKVFVLHGAPTQAQEGSRLVYLTVHSLDDGHEGTYAVSDPARDNLPVPAEAAGLFYEPADDTVIVVLAPLDGERNVFKLSPDGAVIAADDLPCQVPSVRDPNMRAGSHNAVWQFIGEGGTLYRVDTLDLSIVATVPGSEQWGAVGGIPDGAHEVFVPGAYASIVYTPDTRTGYVGYWRGERRDKRLNALVEDLCISDGARERYGIGERDVSTIELSTEPVVRGMVLANQQSARGYLQPLRQAFVFDVFEGDGVLKFKSRRDYLTPLFRVTLDELSARSAGSEQIPALAFDRQGELDMPEEIAVNFTDPETNYETGVQRATDPTTLASAKTTLVLPLVMTSNEAKEIAEVMLRTAYAERLPAKMTLPPKYQGLEPGDLFEVETLDRLYKLRAMDVAIGANMIVAVTAVVNDARDYVSIAQADAYYGYRGEGVGAGTLTAYAFELPQQPDQRPNADTNVVLAALTRLSPMPPVQTLRNDSEGQHDTVAVLTRSAIGYALDTLPDCTEDRRFVIDYRDTLDIALYAPVRLTNATRAQLAQGANRMLVGREVIQYLRADPLDDVMTQWRLYGLLRGRTDTAHVMGTHSPGETVLALREVVYDKAFGGGLGATAFYDFRVGRRVTRVGVQLDGASRRPFRVANPRAIGGPSVPGVAFDPIDRHVRGFDPAQDRVQADGTLSFIVRIVDATGRALATKTVRGNSATFDLTDGLPGVPEAETAVSHLMQIITVHGDGRTWSVPRNFVWYRKNPYEPGRDQFVEDFTEQEDGQALARHWRVIFRNELVENHWYVRRRVHTAVDGLAQAEFTNPRSAGNQSLVLKDLPLVRDVEVAMTFRRNNEHPEPKDDDLHTRILLRAADTSEGRQGIIVALSSDGWYVTVVAVIGAQQLLDEAGLPYSQTSVETEVSRTRLIERVLPARAYEFRAAVKGRRVYWAITKIQYGRASPRREWTYADSEDVAEYPFAGAIGFGANDGDAGETIYDYRVGLNGHEA